MECAYAPFNWTQTTDANGAVPISGKDNLYASGYDVQVAKYIAAELGMSLEVYSYEWDSLIAAVQSGAVDAIIAGMSPTAEREEQVDFTDCYYNSNLCGHHQEVSDFKRESENTNGTDEIRWNLSEKYSELSASITATCFPASAIRCSLP